jgi:hypothetical protein
MLMIAGGVELFFAGGHNALHGAWHNLQYNFRFHKPSLTHWSYLSSPDLSRFIYGGLTAEQLKRPKRQAAE